MGPHQPRVRPQCLVGRRPSHASQSARTLFLTRAAAPPRAVAQDARLRPGGGAPAHHAGRGGHTRLCVARRVRIPPALTPNRRLTDATSSYPVAGDGLHCNCGCSTCRGHVRAFVGARAGAADRRGAPSDTQVDTASDYKRPDLQERYGKHFLPSILALQMPGAPEPVIKYDDDDEASAFPERSGLCGTVTRGAMYCPLF
jgi:hypothetical protein